MHKKSAKTGKGEPAKGPGLHVVSVLKLADPIQNSAKNDEVYLLHMASVFLQYIMFTQANQSHIWFGHQEWTFGGFVCKVGMLTSCLLQIVLIWLLFVLNKLSFKSACVITVFVSMLWAPFFVHRVAYNDEQIVAIQLCASTRPWTH